MFSFLRHPMHHLDWVLLALFMGAMGATATYVAMQPRNQPVEIARVEALPDWQWGLPPMLVAHDVLVRRECTATASIKVTTLRGQLLFIDTVTAGYTPKGFYEEVPFAAFTVPLPETGVHDVYRVLYDRIDHCPERDYVHQQKELFVEIM